MEEVVERAGEKERALDVGNEDVMRVALISDLRQNETQGARERRVIVDDSASDSVFPSYSVVEMSLNLKAGAS